MITSVLICTKDRREDLLSAIESIMAQSLLPNEIVIVDAGSTEGLEKEWNWDSIT